MVHLATFIGRAIAPRLPVLAHLCTIVFREWPHLYDGDGGYDSDHLQALATSQRSALVIAYDGETPIGAATCLPLSDAAANFQAPFRACGLPVARFFYLAESVLLPTYRRQGLGAAFFARREAHIQAVSDCDFACFCSLLDRTRTQGEQSFVSSATSLWRRLGYAPVPDIQCSMRWRQIGQSVESDHRMQFWVRSLSGAPFPQSASA
jgi:GNAT superfamily N-acetyltransferase